jgi:DNA-3-methyladenine glycosylase II
MKIKTENDIQKGLDFLAKQGSVMAEIIDEIGGNAPLRLKPAGFSGLSDIIVSQLLSKTSAAAIFNRLCERVSPLEADEFLKYSFEDLKGVGLSKGKYDTLSGIASAIVDGTLNLEALTECSPDEALKVLTKIKGVGPWSAEVFLLFCAGHRDIFPAGDIALRYGVQDALKLDDMPSEKELRSIATRWSPWRGVAARVIWAYYAHLRKKVNVQP